MSTTYLIFEVRQSRCVNQITNMADLQSKHKYIFYSYRWYTYLATTTCFGLYIGHQAVLFLVIK